MDVIYVDRVEWGNGGLAKGERGMGSRKGGPDCNQVERTLRDMAEEAYTEWAVDVGIRETRCTIYH